MHQHHDLANRVCCFFVGASVNTHSSTRLRSSTLVDKDKEEVTEYFNNNGFDRWNKIYSESDEVNNVQLDIRTGHGQTIEKVGILPVLRYASGRCKRRCCFGCQAVEAQSLHAQPVDQRKRNRHLVVLRVCVHYALLLRRSPERLLYLPIRGTRSPRSRLYHSQAALKRTTCALSADGRVLCRLFYGSTRFVFQLKRLALKRHHTAVGPVLSFSCFHECTFRCRRTSTPGASMDRRGRERQELLLRRRMWR